MLVDSSILFAQTVDYETNNDENRHLIILPSAFQTLENKVG